MRADASEPRPDRRGRRRMRSTPPMSDALADAGFDVIRLPDLPDHPDGVFVEDTALLLDGHAIITRPGAASRASGNRVDGGGPRQAFRDAPRSSKAMSTAETSCASAGPSTSDCPAERTAEGIAAPCARSCGRSRLRSRAGAARRVPPPQDRRDARRAGPTGNAVLLYHPGSVDPSQFAGVEPVAVDARSPAPPIAFARAIA